VTNAGVAAAAAAPAPRAGGAQKVGSGRSTRARARGARSCENTTLRQSALSQAPGTTAVGVAAEGGGGACPTERAVAA